MGPVRVIAPARRPRTGSRGISNRYPNSDEFGAVAALAALVKAGRLVASGAKRHQVGEKVRAWFQDEKRRNAVYEQRYKAAKGRYERAKTEASRARHLKQMLRYQELLEVAKIKASVAAAGVVEPGPHLDGLAIELRRNDLAKQYESAPPDRRVQIEGLIARYDKDLAERKREILRVQQLREAQAAATPKGSQAQIIRRAPELDDTPPPRVEEDPTPRLLERATNAQPPVSPEQAAITGIGGLMAVAKSPPGPGQQVRVAFYPSVPAQSYSGANGIDEPGDDPILLMTGTYAGAGQQFLRLRDSRIQTRFFDYGKYRLLGVVAHFQNNYMVKTAAGAKKTSLQNRGVALIIRSMSVYNGEDLFLPDLNSMPLDTYNIFPTPDSYTGINTGVSVSGIQEAPYNPRWSSRHFIGLRTNPVIEGTARIQASVGAFCWIDSAEILAGDFIEIPVSVSLVCQMLEDKVFGNPIVVGPAARAGAQVNLGLADEGVDTDGVRQYVLKNPRYTPPKEG